ncbi:hypothetical protein P9X10_00845 [Bacillus cereus]|nr:hypothetical protein [Bacillus cereus]
MKLSREEVLALVNELSCKDAKVSWYLKRANGDFYKLPQIRQIAILHKLGIKREVTTTKTFRNKEGTRIEEKDFMVLVRGLARENEMVSMSLEKAEGDYFQIPLDRRRKIEDKLNIKATQSKATRYERYQ